MCIILYQMSRENQGQSDDYEDALARLQILDDFKIIGTA